ncbi:MAG: hypothetical protein M5U28_45885 [Sandaracinaceae bacterium]|nr:hypothetical protein [Sandaracinaceae bacterium]
MAQAAAACWIARSDRASAAVGWWSAALAAAWVARAVVPAAWAAPAGALDTACVAVQALGTWALARRVLERGRGLLALAVGAGVVAIGAYPELPAHARDGLHTAAWAAGLAGAAWSIARAIRARRAAEPTAAHFVVLAYTALAAIELASSPVRPRIAPALGALCVVLAQIAWMAAQRRRKADVGDRPEQPGALERGGDLVDVAPPLRGRAARRAGAARGLGEP